MRLVKCTLYIILILWFTNVDLLASENTSIYNVRDHGAIGDGKTLDTKAIQETIDQCAKEGGKVYLPSGVYLSGSLRLRSNVTIEISEGATLLGSTNIKDYEGKKRDILELHFIEEVNNLADIAEILGANRTYTYSVVSDYLIANNIK